MSKRPEAISADMGLPWTQGDEPPVLCGNEANARVAPHTDVHVADHVAEGLPARAGIVNREGILHEAEWGYGAIYSHWIGWIAGRELEQEIKCDDGFVIAGEGYRGWDVDGGVDLRYYCAHGPVCNLGSG